jgi:hypothetical protein
VTLHVTTRESRPTISQLQAVTQQPTRIWPVAMYSQKAYGAPDMTIPFSGSSRYLVLGERYFCDSACHNRRIPSHYLSDHSNSPCFDKVYFQFLQEPIIYLSAHSFSNEGAVKMKWWETKVRFCSSCDMLSHMQHILHM